MSEYNHDRAKVLCPEAAAEVERLREELAELKEKAEFGEQSSAYISHLESRLSENDDDLCPTCVKALGVELARKCPARAS